MLAYLERVIVRANENARVCGFKRDRMKESVCLSMLCVCVHALKRKREEVCECVFACVLKRE